MTQEFAGIRRHCAKRCTGGMRDWPPKRKVAVITYESGFDTSSASLPWPPRKKADKGK
jgi:hypothetical protein